MKTMTLFRRPSPFHPMFSAVFLSTSLLLVVSMASVIAWSTMSSSKTYFRCNVLSFTRMPSENPGDITRSTRSCMHDKKKAIQYFDTVLKLSKGSDDEEGGTKGFGPRKKEKSATNDRIYSLPSLYDLAFGYRNYEEEIDFLLRVHREVSPKQQFPKTILELGAGPARHSIEALRSEGGVEQVIALDKASEMVQYGLEIATLELESQNVKVTTSVSTSSDLKTPGAFHYQCDDMCNFQLSSFDNNEDHDSAFVDSAWILLGSLQHLTTNDQVLSCFQCVHKVLVPGGTLILELPHPQETFSMVECTRNGWEVPLDDEDGKQYGELKIVWGDDDDEFDPIQQVRQMTVSMTLESDQGSSSSKLQNVREVVPTRLFTAQEIDALAKCSGFQVTKMYGALAEDVSVKDIDEAFRLVCILRKES